ALEYLNKSKGWEIGVGPSLVEVHAGFAGALTPITAKEDLYAFFFSIGRDSWQASGFSGPKLCRSFRRVVGNY
ncbi:MAG TPA: hypothetical protein PKM72_04375, partial [Nitrospirales bacterium]|nr:hypothetical protein [Nitrospirales bacterium]